MLLLLIAGIVLRATGGWFADQHVVGDILIWVGAITTLLWVAFAAWLVGFAVRK